MLTKIDLSQEESRVVRSWEDVEVGECVCSKKDKSRYVSKKNLGGHQYLSLDGDDMDFGKFTSSPPVDCLIIGDVGINNIIGVCSQQDALRFLAGDSPDMVPVELGEQKKVIRSLEELPDSGFVCVLRNGSAKEVLPCESESFHAIVIKSDGLGGAVYSPQHLFSNSTPDLTPIAHTDSMLEAAQWLEGEVEV